MKGMPTKPGNYGNWATIHGSKWDYDYAIDGYMEKPSKKPNIPFRQSQAYMEACKAAAKHNRESGIRGRVIYSEESRWAKAQ